MVNFWQNKKVIVTGGNGFLGKHLVNELNANGCIPFIPDSKHYDLRFPLYIDAMLKNTEADILFHLAGNVGGIGYNLERPYGLFYDNATMGMNLIHAAIKHKVKKFVQVGTVCSYPEFTPAPFVESDLWNGYPEPSNAPYGLAKKMLLVQLQSARKEFGFNGIYLIPTNLYGPGDEFGEYKSHVIPALIKKFLNPDKDYAEVWGGNKPITRDFLFVKDAARAIVKAAETYNDCYPINIGSGEETSIFDLVDLIGELTGFEKWVKWNNSKPEGQEKRVLDISKAEKELFWNPEVSLRQGLKETIEWYKKEKLNA